jgi:hypothetical protein
MKKTYALILIETVILKIKVFKNFLHTECNNTNLLEIMHYKSTPCELGPVS